MKKILSMTLALIILLSVCTFSSVSAAEDETFTCGDAKYFVQEDGTAAIIGFADGIKDVVIPATVDQYPVTSIYRYAFRDDRVIESVVIPEGITSIGFQAFYNCPNLSSITLPDSLRDIARSVFVGTAFYQNSQNWENGVLYIGNHLITSKDTISGTYEVREGTITLAYEAFRFKYKLEEVILPDSIRALGDEAFSLCERLKKINLPEGLEDMGWSVFNGCALESINIPRSLTYINRYVFRGNDFTEIELHDGITYIGDSAFSNCDNLTEITIPDSVTEIDNYVFIWSDNLETINLPDTLTSIGYTPVYGTAYSNNPDNWEGGCLYIGEYLMQVDEDYRGVVEVCDGTRIIAGGAFMDCYEITGAVLPDSIEIIGNQAFGRCEKLAFVNIPESLTAINPYVFSECPSLESIFIPENVTSIDIDAFHDCKNLKTITIASSVTEIADHAIGYYSVYDSIGDMIIGYATNDELTIRAYADTEAQKYAEEHGFSFEEIKVPTGTGDVDGDGRVTVKDATYIQKAVAGMIPLLKEQITCADTNADNAVNVKDATAIQKTVAGLE